MLRYSGSPVPAGIKWPIATFSFNPLRGSTLPMIEASVRILVVSWNDAAETKLRVDSEAFVIPSNNGW
jgi:hypothetical protein